MCATMQAPTTKGNHFGARRRGMLTHKIIGKKKKRGKAKKYEL